MYTSPSQPLSPALTSRVIRRSPIYYGWIIAVAATLGMVMTSPGQTYAVSVFLDHFILDLGISRSLVSTLYTVGTLVGSFALPLIGRQIDARGPRMMTVLISLLFGLACIYMGYVANAVMLGLGFVAIRMFAPWYHVGLATHGEQCDLGQLLRATALGRHHRRHDNDPGCQFSFGADAFWHRP